ncbi:MAG: plasmid stabilization system [Comamonadaceae bacterium PBBC2]|nr:MAG: plasmid stabilization system [Comamonadaceae bacterium PBBC2]
MVTAEFARSAQTDLLEAWLFIAEENQIAADRVLDTIEHEAHLLLTQPLMGRARSELGVGVRSWPTSTSYILYYVVSSNGIIVLRVLHHAPDVKQFHFGHLQ